MLLGLELGLQDPHQIVQNCLEPQFQGIRYPFRGSVDTGTLMHVHIHTHAPEPLNWGWQWCNPSFLEVKAVGALGSEVQGHHHLYSKFKVGLRLLYSLRNNSVIVQLLSTPSLGLIPCTKKKQVASK